MAVFLAVENIPFLRSLLKKSSIWLAWISQQSPVMMGYTLVSCMAKNKDTYDLRCEAMLTSNCDDPLEFHVRLVASDITNASVVWNMTFHIFHRGWSTTNQSLLVMLRGISTNQLFFAAHCI
jgi:hypothetical protein